MLAALLVAVVLVGSVASGQVGDAIATFKDPKEATRVTDPTRLLSSTSGNRWAWWNEAAGAWSAKPVAGWGAGSFGVTHLLYRDQLLTVRQPHSVPLQWLAETGIVGLLLGGGALLVLLAAGLARVRSLEWAVGGAPPERGASAALLAIAVAWVVHGLYDWDWDIPAVTLPTMLCLGLLMARPRPGPSLPVGPRGPALVGALVAFVLLCLSFALPAYAQTRVNTALRTAAREGGPTTEQLGDAAKAAALAVTLNPLSDDGLYAGAIVAERAGDLELARTLLLRAIDRQPYSVQAWIELARLDFIRQDRAGLRRESLRALRLDPINPITIDLARRAQQAAVLPYESASATGTPLETEVQAGPVPVPAPAPIPTPSPLPTPGAIPPPLLDQPAPATPPAVPVPTSPPAPAPTAAPTARPDGTLPPVRTSGDSAPTPEP